jgi:hypothetical protein
MNGVSGTSATHHVVRHVVQKAAPESDAAAFAASALQGNAGMERTQSNNTSSDDSEERVNEAFAKMKVALQNTDSSSESTGMTVAAGQGTKTASQQFMDFMHLSPREKIRAGMLAEMGITQEEYDAMSPEDKAKIDKKIEDRVKQEAQEQVAETSSSQASGKTNEARSSQDKQETASSNEDDNSGKNASLTDLLAS